MMHKILSRAALVAGATLTLGACNEYYGGNVGYASDYQGYAGGYDQTYDSYYGNPYGYSSVPFGYVGGGFGWYGDYYYPGTGYYVYDRGGRRREWTQQQRSFWAQRGRDRGGYQGNGVGGRDGYRDGRRDDRNGRGNGWDGRRGDRRNDGAVVTNTQPATPGSPNNGGWNGQRRGDDRRAQGQAYRQNRREIYQQNRAGSPAAGVAAPQQQQGVAPPAPAAQPRPDRQAFRAERQQQRSEAREQRGDNREAGRRENRQERPQ